MKKKTTYGLSPERIARLLAIGLEETDRGNDVEEGRTEAEALQDMLEIRLPLNDTVPDSLPPILNLPREGVLPLAGQTMRQLLLSSETVLPLIEVVKDYGKALVRRRDLDAKHEAATVVYYAAIASALVFHRNKITRHSYGRLQNAYEDLKQKKWIPSDLNDLFRKAKAACEERKA